MTKNEHDRTKANEGHRECCERVEIAESRQVRFAHLKTHHRFERMRLRGLSGARDEFHLAAIVQNLKTLANYICRPPDATVACAT